MDKPVFAEIRKWTRNGISVEYGLAGRADAPVLLLLHAIRTTKMLFAGIVPELARHYRVIAVDLRGHGGSAGAGEYSFAAIVDDLVGLLDAEGVERATVAAASFAAVPAQLLAVREPWRIARLILMDGGFYRLGEMPGFDLAKTVQRLADTRFASVQEAERQFADRYGGGNLPHGWMAAELERKEDGGCGYRLAKEAFAAYFREYAAFDKEALFSSIPCPVLLLLADERLLPDDEQRAFIRDAAAFYRHSVARADVRTIPGSLHLLMVTHPEETVKAIRTFA
ncbi:alpha/beta fold hydrolase [Brevibacillus sp. GCM10020057]|uniref:alpha/beta fold hydrolase n=1 Tax=Brevibacillus sp. GCM10020057 TaxID=3317327 RepID=UPI0036372DE9